MGSSPCPSAAPLIPQQDHASMHIHAASSRPLLVRKCKTHRCRDHDGRPRVDEQDALCISHRSRRLFLI